MNENKFNLTNIKMLCENEGITFAELERETGIGNGVIRRWAKGEKGPTVNSLITLANYFHVSLDYICGIAKKPSADNSMSMDGLTEKQIQLIQIIQDLTPLEVDLLLAQAKIEIARRKSQDDLSQD